MCNWDSVVQCGARRLWEGMCPYCHRHPVIFASDYHAGSNSAETWQLKKEEEGLQRKKQGVGCCGEALFIVYANMRHCVNLSHKQFKMMPSSVVKPFELLHSCENQQVKLKEKKHIYDININIKIKYVLQLLIKINYWNYMNHLVINVMAKCITCL